MASSVKTVSDAIQARLCSAVDSLNENTVSTFAGSLKEFVELGSNLPFAGVSLAGIKYSELNSDGSLAEEHLTFQVLAIAEDFRGRSFSVENTYGLVDSIRASLMGQTLGLSGLAPVRITEVIKDEEAEKEGLAVYRIKLNTWQVRQMGS